jgi:uncharacterized protein (TIGR02099 family)
VIATWRVHLRRLRFAILAAAATCVILLGVLAGLTQLAMPWLAQHPQQVEHWLSDRLGRPVTIGRLDGRWMGGGPLLSLDDVRIGGDTPASTLVIPHAELAFDLLALVQRNRAVSEFRLADVELKLVHEGGEWKLRDLDLGASGKSDEPFSMGALGALEITRLKLGIEDVGNNVHVQLVAPVLRVLNRGAGVRVLGRVRRAGGILPPLDLVADLDAGSRSGEIYFGGRDVDFARAGEGIAPAGIRPVSGRGALQLWARVAQGRVEDVRMRLDARMLQLSSDRAISVDDPLAIEPRVAFERLSLVARWMREAGGWSLDVADLVANNDPPARLSIERRGDDADPRWRAGAAALQFEPLGDLVMLAADVPAGLRRWLYLAHPRGVVEHVGIDWDGSDDYRVEARLRGVELASVESIPGVEHLDLDLIGDAGALLAQLPAKAIRVDYPHVFRRPFLFGSFGGDVVARRVDEGWRIETDRIGFEGEGYGGELRGSIDIAASRRPRVDLSALVAHGEVVAAKLFWPTTSMSPRAIEWLDRALVSGRIIEGRAAIHGDLDDWPFHDRSGRFVAAAHVVDTTLDYHENWPPAEHVDAVATFVNDGVRVDADSLSTMGNKVGQASASIEDFGPLVLDLSAKAEGSGANLLAFLRATPIGKRYQDQLKDIVVGGKGEVAFALNLPIKQTEALTLDGSVDLVGAKLDHNAYGLHFADASGVLRFNQKGFVADQLDTLFRERKAKLTIAVGGFVSEPQDAFEASVSGTYPVSSVFADVPMLLPLLGNVQGESEWTARVAVKHAEDGVARSALSLDSGLVGTAIDLPPPLAKSADANVPFHLELGLPVAGQAFTARLGDIASLSGRAPGPDRAFGARIEFGSGKSVDPPAAGVVIAGRMPRLDAGAWVERVGSGSGSAGVVQSIDVRAADFVLGGRHFDDTGLKVENAPATTTITLDGAAIAGSLEVPRSDMRSRGIGAHFARVHWPEAPADAPDADAFSDVTPAALPPLHLRVDDFQLGKASFGSARFDSHPVPGGMQIDTLESQSPNVTMSARGDWTGGIIENRTNMSIELSARNLGRMMDALGFPGLIDGGSTKATIDASWLGPPSAFALAKLDGTLGIDVAEGRILDVEPGAGRLFGLFSLTEIPRRLSLDFSDFFQSGLGFNSITGTFRLAGGNAYTDGLKIKSPAADIVVSGRTGLRSKDYDQLMDVQPHAGATLPIVGALAAGPVGAAAGLVMQGLLNKPIGKAVARRYKVSGSWEKPQITQLARTRPKRLPADVPDVPDEPAPSPSPPPAAHEPAHPPALWEVPQALRDDGLQ